MPLNSTGKAKEVLLLMHELPEDKDAIYDGEGYYSTKVMIYDKKCSGCGFAYIIARSSDGVRKAFTKIDEALNFNTSTFPIVRSCEYPLDIFEFRHEDLLPSLSEIVSNGCELWAVEHMDIPKDEETEFIEITDVSELNTEFISGGAEERVPEQQYIRKALHCEAILQ